MKELGGLGLGELMLTTVGQLRWRLGLPLTRSLKDGSALLPKHARSAEVHRRSMNVAVNLAISLSGGLRPFWMRSRRPDADRTANTEMPLTTIPYSY